MSAPVLNHDAVIRNGEPRLWLYVLHGIYGAGRNWATVARRITEKRPDWGAVLVDLRQHGASQGFSPPHTMAATAADLTRLEQATVRPAAAVLGHSFGGKVALRWCTEASHLRQVWVIDSTPQAGDPSGSAWRMLETIRALPERFDSRADAIRQMEAHGIDTPVAQWMATNLERHDGILRWRFDLSSIETLLRDFFRTDLWSVIETPPAGVDIHMVKATESSVLSGESLARLERAALANEQLHLHVLNGGHWLNADNPTGVIDLVAEALPAGALG